jgi:hypothetical protein
LDVNFIQEAGVVMANSKRESHKELESLKKHWGEEAAKLRDRLKQAEERVAALALTIQLLDNSPSTTAEDNPYIKEFKGMTQVAALVKIARDNGTNRFKLQDAKKLLLEAGLIRSKKNASTILFTTIQRSGRFRRVAPGEYEVITKEATGIKITQIA